MELASGCSKCFYGRLVPVLCFSCCNLSCLDSFELLSGVVRTREYHLIENGYDALVFFRVEVKRLERALIIYSHASHHLLSLEVVKASHWKWWVASASLPFRAAIQHPGSSSPPSLLRGG